MRLTLLFVLTTLTTMGCNCGASELTFTRTFKVHGETTDPLCNADRQTVSLADEKAFSGAREFIGTVELRKLVVSVANPKTRDDSLATKAHGSVRISSSADAAAIDLGTYGDVPITAGSSQEIMFDKGVAKTLAQLALKKPNTFYVESYGCNDANPAFYDFNVTLTVFAGL